MVSLNNEAKMLNTELYRQDFKGKHQDEEGIHFHPEEWVHIRYNTTIQFFLITLSRLKFVGFSYINIINIRVRMLYKKI